jgi:glyoxylate/hydroxypyruvate reductase A
MSILFYSQADDPQPWRDALIKAFPERIFEVWPDVRDFNVVRYALVWNPPAGMLARFPNLRAVLALGAGVDSLLADPTTPQVPVVRLVDAGLAAQMAEYATYAVLYFHRRMGDYQRQQQDREWKPLEPVAASGWTVGVMGMGVIGTLIARYLITLGYRVRGWSRSGKRVEGVEDFAGDDRFDSFLSGSNAVINVLPLTEHTLGILNARTFAAMPRASYVINIGRGAHLVEVDLLGALESGQIAGAMLDVFNEEPLPPSSPLWAHPDVVITPHVAGVTIAAEAEAQVIANIRRMEAGELPAGIVDRAKGY